MEDLFQLVIPSSCCDEPLKQLLWIDLYCFIVDFDSRCTECDRLVFFLVKLCCNTFCCAIDVNIFSPTSYAVFTFTLIPAFIPVAMLRKLQLTLNGFQDSRNSNSSHVISFPCLALVEYLCCSLMLYCTPVSWVSVMQRPLVKPTLVFMLRMRTCSMTRSGEVRPMTDLRCVQRGALGRSVCTHLDGFHEAYSSAASTPECISCTSYAPRQLSKASSHTLFGCGVPRCPSVLLCGTCAMCPSSS